MNKFKTLDNQIDLKITYTPEADEELQENIKLVNEALRLATIKFNEEKNIYILQGVYQQNKVLIDEIIKNIEFLKENK